MGRYQPEAPMSNLKNLNELDGAPPVKRAIAEGIDPTDIVLDTEQIFLVFASLCGDVDATAAAVGISPHVVARLADAESWADRIAPIVAKRKSTKPGDVERAINRALNFAQAHRYRLFLQRVAQQMYGWTDEELGQFLTKMEPSKKLRHDAADVTQRLVITTRSLADFATALEKAQMMTYLALKDTATDRKGRADDDQGEELSAAALHAQIAKAMSEAREPATAHGQLLAAQAEMAQAAAREAVFVDANPRRTYDNDDH